jgi:hypothetical protein
MLTFRCESCDHVHEYKNLIESATFLGIHPESLRRLARYGEVEPLNIERGLYFNDEQLNALLKTSGEGE